MGILFDFLYEKTNCIWVPTLCHGAINAFAGVPTLFLNPAYADKLLLGPLMIGVISGLLLMLTAFILSTQEKNSIMKERYTMYHPRLRGNHYDMGQRYEVVACWLFALYCFESDHGCSVFSVRSGEHIYFGRNMDMFPEYKKTSESVLYMPENKWRVSDPADFGGMQNRRGSGHEPFRYSGNATIQCGR